MVDVTKTNKSFYLFLEFICRLFLPLHSKSFLQLSFWHYTCCCCIEIEFHSFVYGWLVTKDKQNGKGTYVGYVFFFFFFTSELHLMWIECIDELEVTVASDGIWVFSSFFWATHKKIISLKTMIVRTMTNDDFRIHKKKPAWCDFSKAIFLLVIFICGHETNTLTHMHKLQWNKQFLLKNKK